MRWICKLALSKSQISRYCRLMNGCDEALRTCPIRCLGTIFSRRRLRDSLRPWLLRQLGTWVSRLPSPWPDVVALRIQRYVPTVRLVRVQAGTVNVSIPPAHHTAITPVATGTVSADRTYATTTVMIATTRVRVVAAPVHAPSGISATKTICPPLWSLDVFLVTQSCKGCRQRNTWQRDRHPTLLRTWSAEYHVYLKTRSIHVSATARSTVRLARLELLLLFSIPPAAAILICTHVFRMELQGVLIFCGLVVAVVGGCSKIGSP